MKTWRTDGPIQADLLLRGRLRNVGIDRRAEDAGVGIVQFEEGSL